MGLPMVKGPTHSKRGFTLIEVVVGSVLIGLIFYVVIRSINSLLVWKEQSRLLHQASEDLRLAGFAIQNRLSGTFGFPTLSFRVPGTALRCRRSSFCVDPNKDF